MANVTGAGGAVPQLNRQSGSIAGAPTVSYGNTPAANPGALAPGFKDLATVLHGISSKIEDRLDIEAAVAAGDEGTNAGVNGIPDRRDDATIRGAAFNKSAREAVATQFEMKSRQALADYEKAHFADPRGFQDKGDKYLQGLLPEMQGFDPALAQHFQNNFKLQQLNALNRVTARADSITADRQLENALTNYDQIERDQATLSAQLFSSGSANVMQVMTQMTSNAQKMADLSIMTGPHGQPLFDARQRVKLRQSAEETVSSQIGTAWLQRQPDQIAALDSWQKGEAFVDVTDNDGQMSRMNLADVLSPSGYASAQKGFTESLRANLSLQSQIHEAKDRSFRDGSDSLFKDLSVAAQSGTLTLPIVDAAKTSLEADKYVALREVARRGGASVSDGAAVSRMSVADTKGVDIRGELLTEFTAGRLTTDDYLKLYDRNSTRLTKGQPDPVSTGRDYVGNSLGKLSTELGFAQSMSIPQAEAEYVVRVEDFVRDNGRQPSTTEALDISRDVVRRYAVVDTSATIAALPLPKYMQPAQKFNANAKVTDITAVAMRTRAEFLKSHNGNLEAVKADPQYQEEMKLLKQYYTLIQHREQDAVKPAK
ncbi:MAG: hypothetical protein PSY14_06710 [bacterium]|nr:hypothetical protein [bacterium]